MTFGYADVAKEDVEMVFDRGAIRIRPTDEKTNFGSVDVEDADGSVLTFTANEIVFHTPGEHTIRK